MWTKRFDRNPRRRSCTFDCCIPSWRFDRQVHWSLVFLSLPIVIEYCKFSIKSLVGNYYKILYYLWLIRFIIINLNFVHDVEDGVSTQEFVDHFNVHEIVLFVMANRCQISRPNCDRVTLGSKIIFHVILVNVFWVELPGHLLWLLYRRNCAVSALNWASPCNGSKLNWWPV